MLRFELKNGIFESWTLHESFRSISYLLMLRFELENGIFESWTLHESFRPISYLSIKINQT